MSNTKQPKQTTVLGWHFTGDKLRDGRPIPPVGEWLTHDGDVVMCKSGLHLSKHPYDALKYAPGATLHRVRGHGDIIESEDKIVCHERVILWTIPAETMQTLLWNYARWCAFQVVHLWDAPDVVVKYLKTGDESLRAAARAAAQAASWASRAAREASWAASKAASWAASWEAREASWATSWAAWAASRATSWAARATSREASEEKQRAKLKAMIMDARKELAE